MWAHKPALFLRCVPRTRHAVVLMVVAVLVHLSLNVVCPDDAGSTPQVTGNPKPGSSPPTQALDLRQDQEPLARESSGWSWEKQRWQSRVPGISLANVEQGTRRAA